MKSERHLEIYRVAFESANSELTEISAEVQKLQARKEQIERLIVVLRPLVDDEENAPAEFSAESESTDQGEAAAESPVEESPQPAQFTADPFQRRIDHVLGIGAGIRDVRKYSRQF